MVDRVTTPGPTQFPLSPPDGWLEYADWRGEAGSVVGRVLVRPGVASVEPPCSRHILVYLPPSLAAGETGRRYPVLYMHDGQNLFDEGTSGSGEWQVDEAMERLAGEGLEAIVVGIPNAEAADPPQPNGRAVEYSPHPHENRGGGGADAYLAFIAGTVKPLIDATFPAMRDLGSTGIAGSSLGGLISLYALVARPDVFGFAGIVSPALWFAGGRLMSEHAPSLWPGENLRVYLDVGGREGDHETDPARRAEMNRRYVKDARSLRRLLVGNGFREGDDLLYVEDAEARHHESAWAARVPGMLRFLLRPLSGG